MFAPQNITEEQELALAYTPEALRWKMAAFFALDARLAQIVANTHEPMLGQMRLAWWRDMLGTTKQDRPAGDDVLDAIGEHWNGQEASLVKLVDAWEILIAEEELSAEAIVRFGAGRAAPAAALADPAQARDRDRVLVAATRWALADAASKISGESERHGFVEAGLAQPAGKATLSKPLRGLAVLEALALRALKRGGRPLMEGRGAALVALRAGLIGR